MKVTFIHHSSFCVEMADKVFLFDYFRGDRVPGITFHGKLPEFDPAKSIYVFASHKHPDHFDLEILTWKNKYPDIRYIFPKEIKFSDSYLIRHGIDPSVKEQINYIKPGSVLNLDGVKTEALLSTDSGVAFLISYAGKTIYHAGDLHWWHWEGEEASFNEYQEKTYKQEIDKLKDRKLELAFVVLDPRLEGAKFWGMDYFMHHVAAKHVIPMHLWQNYGMIEEYKSLPESRPFRERIPEVTGENQIFDL